VTAGSVPPAQPLSLPDRLCRLAFAPALVVVLAGSVADFGDLPQPAGSDKLEHAVAFLVLGMLALRGFPRLPAWRAIFPGLLAYGMLIECIQWTLPWRQFSIGDWVADGVGVVLACAVLMRRSGAAPGERR
jgi:VanZ family protein